MIQPSSPSPFSLPREKGNRFAPSSSPLSLGRERGWG
jgi:hypothetical protein